MTTNDKLDLDECEAIAKIAYLPQDMTLQLIARLRSLESARSGEADERAAFEAWFRRNVNPNSTMERHPDDWPNNAGEYRSIITEDRWKTWLGRAALAAPQPAAAEPEGYVLVPKEPTEKMVEHAIYQRADLADFRYGHKPAPYAETRAQYRAMIAAAPPCELSNGGEGE